MNNFNVKPISPEEARPIREAILRPGLPAELSIFPDDDHSLTFHVGAYQEGKLIGVASLFPQPPPFDEGNTGWRLRGMAVMESARRKGIGAALVRACLAYISDNGGGVAWCNARTSVAPFYKSLGFQEYGEEFDVPESGPHYVMWRDTDQ